MKLHGYFRSSAAFRVRIALNLKGLNVEHCSHHLRMGEQRSASYLALNPQGLVPTLELDSGGMLSQSLAIIEWLDETHPLPPLLPPEPWARARVRAIALAVSCDIHPVQNLKVLNRLRGLGLDEAAVVEWAAWANREGPRRARPCWRRSPVRSALGRRPHWRTCALCRNSAMRGASW